MKGLVIDIYTNPAYAGCANGGISERVNQLTVIEIDGRPIPKSCQIFEPSEDRPAARLISRIIGRESYVHIEPMESVPGDDHTDYMAGGAIVYTSDSRWEDLTGIPYPLKLHDRTETWNDHRVLGS